MLPTGIICLWYGAIVNIPTGWIICDGNNGTPNLQNRFLVGAGDTYAVGANGGNINHNHEFTGDGHTHTIPGGPALATGPNFSDTTDSSAATGTTDNENGLPPYHSLAYIMKT